MNNHPITGLPESDFDRNVRSLVHTSVDDLKSSLDCSYRDSGLPILQEVLKQLEGLPNRTAARKLVAARIKRLKAIPW